ncbi:MAG: SAM-dependent methyltransferase, partial [Brevundimonas sp.]|nr:SAM-dependent methyltransferase [Brevundimonas sp.]
MTASTADHAQATTKRTPRVFSLLVRLLSANWTYGTLTLTLPNGEVHRLEGATPG